MGLHMSSLQVRVRTARQEAPHGFRYEQRLVDVDFVPWVFYIGPAYRVVHISG